MNKSAGDSGFWIISQRLLRGGHKGAFQSEKGLLKSVTLFDVYRGNKIPEGKKQYAISFTLQNPEQTLTDSAVENAMNKLLITFEKKFGATLR